MASVRCIRFQSDAAVELATRRLRLVAVTSRGPRIAFFGARDGGNLLYWAPGRHRRGGWDMMGGHRLWTARPGADEAEETYRPDNEPCRLQRLRAGFSITAPIDPVTKIQRGVSVRAVAPDRVEVDHFVGNAGDMLWSGALWAVTCTVPQASARGDRAPQAQTDAGATYSIPLGDGSSWDYATIVVLNRWGAGHGGGGFADPQFTLTRDQFVLRYSGQEGKRLLKADAGILAMRTTDLVFAKRVAYDSTASYPHNANVALYTCAHMVEMETMGPFVTLKPGAAAHHVETWVLREAPPRTLSAASLRALFS